MRSMILGAGGMLGHDLVGTAPLGIEVVPFTKADLDVTDTPSMTTAVAEVQPDIIINAAAFTSVDRAQSERDLAFRVNAEAVGQLGGIAEATGARVVHFSTDYVFDGTASEPYKEESPTDPVNVYGASKLAGENALRESGAMFLIVRTQWLFGVNGRSFPRTMWDRAVARQPSRVVSDQVGCPTYTVDLARATWRLAVSGLDGVINVANAGTATWYDVARRVYSKVNADELVKRCSTESIHPLARRPAWSVLSTVRFQGLLGGALPGWEDALDRFVAELETSASPSTVGQ